ncbi:MAG: HAD-IA family hydrolase [Treponema sp.]|jgi:phosphoglycolate phosphatase|nr:HAD-IA family hydrolase [Treponema sp.]
MKKAYVFDMDGTLANTIYDIGDSVNHVLAAGGFPPHTYNEYQDYIGMGVDVLFNRAMPGYRELSPEKQGEIRRVYLALYGERCLDKVQAYEGIPETLAALAERGVILGIFTNKPEAMARAIAAHLFKDRDFAFVLGALEGVPLKPDPARMLAELKKRDVAPGDAVFVGDGRPDIAAGKNGGLFTCGVSWGFKGLEELEGADAIIDHPRELLDIP